ncbi:MAG: hypothetical protein PHQ43_03595 [Dehalococcoidales bacterium]|nr:hypothetical protein [Dehalococcoidales bacterium]
MLRGLKPIEEYNFVGYRDSVPAETLPRGYLAKAQNCICDNGFIEKRTGYSLIGNDLGDKTCLGLGGLAVGDTRQLVAAFDDSESANAALYSWAGSGNWSAITNGDDLTADTSVDCEMAAGKLYAYNNTDAVKSWDGATCSDVAAVPVTKCLKWFHNYMFALNNDSYKSRLYYSNLGAPEMWGAEDYIDINPDDGDYGTALQVLGDELVIGKRNRIWSFTGWGEDTFTIKTINERVTGYGIESNRCVINTGNDLLFLSFNGDIPVIRSLRRTQYATVIAGGIISEDIENTMRGLSLDYLNKACAVYDGINAWFFVPDGSSTYNDLALRYNTLTKGWTKHSGINASCVLAFAISSQPQIYFGEAQADSKVYRMDSSYSDNGAGIAMEAIGRKHWLSFARKSKFKYLYVTGKEGVDTDVEVLISPDGAVYESLGELNLKASEGIFPMVFPFQFGAVDVVKKRFVPGVTGFALQPKFANTSDEGPVEIRDYQLYAKPKGLRSTS